MLVQIESDDLFLSLFSTINTIHIIEKCVQENSKLFTTEEFNSKPQEVPKPKYIFKEVIDPGMYKLEGIHFRSDRKVHCTFQKTAPLEKWITIEIECLRRLLDSGDIKGEEVSNNVV